MIQPGFSFLMFARGSQAALNREQNELNLGPEQPPIRRVLSRIHANGDGEHMPPACCLRRPAANFSLTHGVIKQ
jgi:hypothetical protein